MQKGPRLQRIKQVAVFKERIRNICVMAHVDHGKTTLVDSLVSSNRIISRKQAGKLKYMDSRVDEQDRGITMKASSITLLSSYALPDQEERLINLIDSPGHIEFGFQVSSALSLTDGALILVDVVQGVTSQTYACLRNAFHQNIKTVLVLNKMDRLVKELQLSPEEAFRRLQQVIESVNAVLGSLLGTRANQEQQQQAQEIDLQSQHFQFIQNQLYFQPQKNNVVFASSLDTWAFTIRDFARLFASKLKASEKAMQRALWGEYYFDRKTKRVLKSQTGTNGPMFSQFILQNIWKVYSASKTKDRAALQKIVKALNLEVPLQNIDKLNQYQIVTLVMNEWLPLERTVMATIVQHLPSPLEAQSLRLQRFCPQIFNSEEPQVKKIKEAICTCSSQPAQVPTVAFISKMVCFPKESINQRGLCDPPLESCTIGFARLFSGQIARGQKLFLISPTPKKIITETGAVSFIKDVEQVTVKSLYVQMGHCLQGVQKITAGNIFGIGGLEQLVIKTGTLSSTQSCPSITPLFSHSRSILKVRIFTPEIHSQGKLLEGLKKLDRADPSVQLGVESNGDITLTTCGEVHLQRCIQDLKQIFGEIPVRVSDPIVTFRQTVTYCNLTACNNQQFIQDKKAIVAHEQQRLQKQKLREQKLQNEVLDDREIQKRKAIDKWHHSVEKYNSDDMTVEDTRYFLKPEAEQKQKFTYVKVERKADHKNRGKTMNPKHTFINIREKTNLVTLNTPNEVISLTVRAIGLPFQFVQFVEKKANVLRTAFYHQTLSAQTVKAEVEQLRCKLRQLVGDNPGLKKLQQLVLQKGFCFGPQKSGPNLLGFRDMTEKGALFGLRQKDWLQMQQFSLVQKYFRASYSQLMSAIVSGFDLATQSGPLCEEPMMGVLFIVQKIDINQKALDKLVTKNEVPKVQTKVQQAQQVSSTSNTFFVKDPYGPLLGQLISTTKNACLQAFLGCNPRLVEPVYLCNIHCKQEHYGSVFHVLNRRRADVLSDQVQEESNLSVIRAHLPVIESFGLYKEMLTKTHGMVNPQLHFDTWLLIEEDPFYAPATAEEIEEHGLENVLPNMARRIMLGVRKRKGILEEKLVLAPEKQRNLSKKK